MKTYIPLFEDFNDDGGIAFPDEDTLKQQFEKYGLNIDDIVYDEIGEEISVAFSSRMHGGEMPRDISKIMNDIVKTIGAGMFTFWEPGKRVRFIFGSKPTNEANYRDEEAFANSSADQFNKNYPPDFSEDELSQPDVSGMTYEDVMAKLETFEPDFEYTDKEIGYDEKNIGRATEYDVWIDFTGVSKEVVREFEKEPDVKDEQFRQWCKNNGLLYSTVMTGAQGESVLFQVISF